MPLELILLHFSLLHSCRSIPAVAAGCSDLAASTAPAFVTVYLDLSQTPRAPIAPACCSAGCHYQCYSSSYFCNWSTSSLRCISNSQRWHYSSSLTQTKGWGSCCFCCWSTSVSWFMSHLQCCYCSSISYSACWLHQGQGFSFLYKWNSQVSTSIRCLKSCYCSTSTCYNTVSAVPFLDISPTSSAVTVPASDKCICSYIYRQHRELQLP